MELVALDRVSGRRSPVASLTVTKLNSTTTPLRLVLHSTFSHSPGEDEEIIQRRSVSVVPRMVDL